MTTTDRVTRVPYGIDEMGTAIDYFHTQKNPRQQYRLETRFGERHLTRETLGTKDREDLTHLLLGRRGKSREAFCTETIAILDGRGIGTNEGNAA
jgi:hypothetical protein